MNIIATYKANGINFKLDRMARKRINKIGGRCTGSGFYFLENIRLENIRDLSFNVPKNKVKLAIYRLTRLGIKARLTT